MESCGGAHYWAREVGKLSHEVRFINPRFIKPYVKSNNNDAHDAEAICEAAGRPSMRFVPVKTEEQQDLPALHRVREQLVKACTALANQIRGLLAERGVVVGKGISRLCRLLPVILENRERRLSGPMRELMAELGERLRILDERIGQYDLELGRLCAQDERCQRLVEVEGVGPFVATAMVAAVGEARQFRSGRELSAWLGLVPGHRKSANREVMLGISKRGDRYLRTLLIHRAGAAVSAAERRRDARSAWVNQIRQKHQRGGTNTAAVALANKNARVLRALLSRNDRYRPAAPASGQPNTQVSPQPGKAEASLCARRGAQELRPVTAPGRLRLARLIAAGTAPASGVE